MYNKFSTLLVLFTFIISSCSKKSSNDNPIPTDPAPTEPPVLTITNEWKNNPYKLNVIYFVPNDLDTVKAYRQRLSRVLLDAQKYFADNMAREGFGRKSFGLDLIDDKTVNIITIKGKLGKTSYPYEGGHNAVIPEITQYYNNNPSLKKHSEHMLIILPNYNGDDMNPSGGPYYGVGTNCYAMDFKYVDAGYLGTSGRPGELATIYIGGLIHELGHGLNASHNAMRQTLIPQFGTALMGAGNYTYGKSTTSLTGATAAQFNNSQTFSTVKRTDWYNTATFALKKLDTKLENNTIVLSGIFETDITVNDVVLWNDPAPFGKGNDDYDAPSWNTKVTSGNNFKFTCDLNDFEKKTGEYELRLGFLHENGSRSIIRFAYNFENNVPKLDHIQIYELQSKIGWQVVEFSTQETVNEDGRALLILDNNINTFWHTPYGSILPNHPHHFVVDFGSSKTYKGVSFTNRSNLTGAMKDIKIFISDDNTKWTLVKSTQLPKTSRNDINLGNNITSKYIKIETVNSWDDAKYTHLAEFGIF